MGEIVRLSARFPVKAKTLYDSWLDGKKHTEMTGGNKASGKAEVGSRFNAYSRYISGKNIDLTKNKRIVQQWKTRDFKKEDLPSLVTINFEEDEKGHTKVSIVHSEIPEGQGKGYREGWKENYLNPMKEYFKEAMTKAAPKQAVARKAKKAATAKKAAPKAKKSAASKKAAPKKRTTSRKKK